MSLFNMLFGKNPFAEELLKMFRLEEPMTGFPVPKDLYRIAEQWNEEMLANIAERAKQERFYPAGRFRDFVVREDGKTLEFLTRNNRGSGFWWLNDILRSHPCYVRDIPFPGQKEGEEDYVAMEFKVPETAEEFAYVLDLIGDPKEFLKELELDCSFDEWIEHTLVSLGKRVKEIADLSDNTSPTVKFEQLFKDMETNADNAQTRHAKEVGEKIFSKILDENTPDGMHEVGGNEGVMIGKFTNPRKKEDGGNP